jgi:putative Mg2+ transporter-C (MgtC) family protein
MVMIDEETIVIIEKLVVSLLIGLVIGAEREYRNKSAGLRTIILICLGSTIFTIVSIESAHETEVARIASNIVTGIGFLGAGAIMRDGLSISGLTTASTIWVAAALGLAVGAGEFEMAVIATVFVLIILVVFAWGQKIFDIWRKTMELYVVFDIEQNGMEEVETKMKLLKLQFERKKESRRKKDVKYQYEIAGNAEKLNSLIAFLIEKKDKIKSFEY